MRLDGVRTLLCDADGCLFPSEGPAFDASTAVTNELLADLGVDKRFTPEELRGLAEGKNFRTTAEGLAASFGVALDGDLEQWVDRERREVSDHLGRVLEPDEAVIGPLTGLAATYALAVVSSSALGRLDACFEATGLADLLPAGVRFSAEDSLPVPTSKPDPAVYLHAGERLGVSGDDALAVEDSVTGTTSAVAAGFPTVGNVQFVPEAERDARVAELRKAGAIAIVSSWAELASLLGGSEPGGRDLRREGDLGDVGDQAVDPEVEQAVHLEGAVHGPRTDP